MIFKFINFLFILQKPYLTLTQELKKQSSFRRKRRTESKEEPNPCSRKDLYLDVSDFNELRGVTRPKRINFGYCSGTCEKKEQKSLRQRVFKEGANDEKEIMDIKDFLDLEKGCCVPKSYHRTSLYDPTMENDLKVRDFKNLQVKDCHCVY